MTHRNRLALLALLLTALTAARAPAEDFAFVHISDIHVSPHLLRSGPPEPLRGGDTIAWICRETAGPQQPGPLGITTPAPALAIATGDLTEYGVIDDTWELFEQAFRPLPCPLYVVPGNHDNTWVALYHVMRRRHGGENYSFDRFGCHFVCICSASPQEPVPTIDGKTRAWLRRDLGAVRPGTPIFVALHHPPDSNELANRAEYDTLIDLLRDHNVVLLLYGHGHGVSHQNFDGIDGIMGGSTFGNNAGYALVSVQNDTLYAAYRYHAPADGREWQPLLTRPLKRSPPQRLFQITAPLPGRVIRDRTLRLVLDLPAPLAGPPVLRADIDGTEARAAPLADAPPVDGRQRLAWEVELAALSPGRHLLSVRLRGSDGAYDLRTTDFFFRDGPLWSRALPAAVKAGPLVADERVYVARTDGVLSALDRRTGETVWEYATGGEILGTPAWSEEPDSGRRLLVFGSGDGKVYALDDSGRALWTFDAAVPVYGAPLVADGTVYIGDNGGRMHALDVLSGRRRWTFERADYAIECRPCVWGELLVFGAWDGYLYALHTGDGRPAWKVWGPKSSAGGAARYYAPADCGPVVLRGTGIPPARSPGGSAARPGQSGPAANALFVCDRGYILATFQPDGSPGQRLAENIAAIAPDTAGQYLYCRSTTDRVLKFDAAGNRLWESSVPAGRFPIPPTERGDAVYVCSNRGLLSVLDAGDGSVRWQYQVTCGFYVMAPVAVAEDRTCYVAGMDGTVTALRPAGNPGRPGD